MRIRKKLGGLILLSVGVGMLVGLMIPGISWLLAGVLIVVGFIYVFL